MTTKHFLFVVTLVAFLSTSISAQVPDKAKVVAGADRAWEKVTKAYVAPAPGCAAAVSLNGEVVFENRLRSIWNVVLQIGKSERFFEHCFSVK